MLLGSSSSATRRLTSHTCVWCRGPGSQTLNDDYGHMHYASGMELSHEHHEGAGIREFNKKSLVFDTPQVFDFLKVDSDVALLTPQLI